MKMLKFDISGAWPWMALLSEKADYFFCGKKIVLQNTSQDNRKKSIQNENRWIADNIQTCLDRGPLYYRQTVFI